MSVEQHASGDDAIPLAEGGEELYAELLRIADILKNEKLDVREALLDRKVFAEHWNDKANRQFLCTVTTPIARDRADGIRINYSNGHWIVTYTNGFEKPTDATRMKIAQLLRDAGLQSM